MNEMEKHLEEEQTIIDSVYEQVENLCESLEIARRKHLCFQVGDCRLQDLMHAFKRVQSSPSFFSAYKKTINYSIPTQLAPKYRGGNTAQQ